MSPALRFLCSQHWAMVPEVFDALRLIVEQHDAGQRASPEQVRRAQGMRAGFSMMDDDGGEGEALMQVRGDTAVIPIRGVLARYADQINGACQDQGRSAESIQADLAKATANPGIARIVLRIDSPGGSVAGTAETGAAIKAASEAGKQVIAFVDGLAASAGYWLASQADEVVASAAGSLVGSIGVIMATVDATKAQEKQGYNVRVHRSVDLKAPGTANESLSAAQVESIGRVLAGLHEQFTSAVSAGRGMDAQQMATAATGEVFTAAQGMALGLVDRIASWDSVMGDRSRGARATKAIAAEAPVLPLAESPQVTKEAHDMSLMKQAKAIADKHPAHAALVWEMACADKTEDEIVAAVGVAEKDAKATADAARLVDLEARVTAAETKATDAATAQAKAERERDEAKAAQAALAAHAKGGAAGALVKPDGDSKSGPSKITRAEYEANPSAYADAITKGETVLAD